MIRTDASELNVAGCAHTWHSMDLFEVPPLLQRALSIESEGPRKILSQKSECRTVVSRQYLVEETALGSEKGQICWRWKFCSPSVDHGREVRRSLDALVKAIRCI